MVTSQVDVSLNVKIMDSVEKREVASKFNFPAKSLSGKSIYLSKHEVTSTDSYIVKHFFQTTLDMLIIRNVGDAAVVVATRSNSLNQTRTINVGQICVLNGLDKTTTYWPTITCASSSSVVVACIGS